MLTKKEIGYDILGMSNDEIIDYILKETSKLEETINKQANNIHALLDDIKERSDLIEKLKSCNNCRYCTHDEMCFLGVKDSLECHDNKQSKWEMK